MHTAHVIQQIPVVKYQRFTDTINCAHFVVVMLMVVVFVTMVEFRQISKTMVGNLVVPGNPEYIT